MPEFGYSFHGYDPLTHVKASAREVDVSHKAAREVCNSIKNKFLPNAKIFLEGVSSKKVAVAFRRHKLKVGHRSELSNFQSGRYPVKTAKVVLEILNNLEANAEFKGFDVEKLKIVHSAVSQGRKVKGFVPRAFGRSSPSFNTMVHIELVGRGN